MPPSALGLDGSSHKDLRVLRKKHLEWPADHLREVECRGGRRLRPPEGYTTLILKKGPPRPLSARPLTLIYMI